MHTGARITSGVRGHTHKHIRSHCDYVRSCCGLLIDGLLAGLVVQGQRTEIEGSSLEITTAATVIS